MNRQLNRFNPDTSLMIRMAGPVATVGTLVRFE
jgi:hypothetical protein